MIDEKGFHQHLAENIKYSNDYAISHDVACVSAIMRMRRGIQRSKFEGLRSIFVTMNAALVRQSALFLVSELPPGTIGPCVTDSTLANVLWLKQPTRAPDLPRKRIIADCYAAVQPDDRLWALYLIEIDKLESRGEVSPDQYYLLRSSMEAKAALMNVTPGRSEALTGESVRAVIAAVREQIGADVRAEMQTKIDNEERLRQDAEKQLRVEQDRLRARQRETEEREVEVDEQLRGLSKTIRGLQLQLEQQQETNEKLQGLGDDVHSLKSQLDMTRKSSVLTRIILAALTLIAGSYILWQSPELNSWAWLQSHPRKLNLYACAYFELAVLALGVIIPRHWPWLLGAAVLPVIGGVLTQTL